MGVEIQLFEYTTNLVRLVHFPAVISSELANDQNVDEVESVLQSVGRSPRRSARRISTGIGVPHTRVWRTLRQHLLYTFHL